MKNEVEIMKIAGLVSAKSKEAITALRQLRRAKDTAKQAEKEIKTLTPPIRAYLVETGEPLYDGETGIHARLAPGRALQPIIEVGDMSDADLLLAARGGLLQAVPQATADAVCRSRTDLATLWARYTHRGQGEPVLMVGDGKP